LKEHKRQQAEERLKAGRNYQALDLVFATTEGGPLMPQNLLRRHFRPILKRADLPQTVRIYDLRHSCATLLLAAQENPKVVSERLGHATITLTLDTYSHVLPSMQRAATDKLDDMLFSKLG
jgi:integrase